MPPEPTATNFECAVFILMATPVALLLHLLRYSHDRLRALAVKRLKALGAPGPGADSAMLDEVVAGMRAYRFSGSTLSLDWLGVIALPACMWIGVRLMDAGVLRSLWPWAVMPGCVLMGLFHARSEAQRVRRVDALLEAEFKV